MRLPEGIGRSAEWQAGGSRCEDRHREGAVRVQHAGLDEAPSRVGTRRTVQSRGAPRRLASAGERTSSAAVRAAARQIGMPVPLAPRAAQAHTWRTKRGPPESASVRRRSRSILIVRSSAREHRVRGWLADDEAASAKHALRQSLKRRSPSAARASGRRWTRDRGALACGWSGMCWSPPGRADRVRAAGASANAAPRTSATHREGAPRCTCAREWPWRAVRPPYGSSTIVRQAGCAEVLAC